MIKRFFKHRAVAVITCCCAGILVLSGILNAAVPGGSPIHKITGTIIKPFQVLFSKAFGWVGDLSDSVKNYNALEEDNRKLRDEIHRLEQLNLDAAKYKEENELLRAMLEMNAREREFVLEAAYITGWDDVNWGSLFKINKGENYKIKVGDSVIWGEIFVGTVYKVGPDWAEVTTLIDTMSSVEAVVQRTREHVAATGNFNQMKEGCFRVPHLDTFSDIMVGDRLETSGLGGQGRVPPGLLLGTVVGKATDETGFNIYASVEPFVDLSRLKQVMIVLDFKIVD